MGDRVTVGVDARIGGLSAVPRFGSTIDIMRVTIQLPDDISAALEEQWDDVPRRSLEAIAVEDTVGRRASPLAGSHRG